MAKDFFENNEITKSTASEQQIMDLHASNQLDNEGKSNGREETDPFQTFLDKAKEYYSMKKTLLYAEKPHPFYEIYVCNDLTFHRTRFVATHNSQQPITITDATAARLKQESAYSIIEGTGGIGKSMFLTHLFLNATTDYASTNELPVLISLKDYNENISSIVEFIWLTIKAFDPDIIQKDIVVALESKQLILLMDGLDEIQSSLKADFETDLEAFIKSYPGNVVIITSRPTNTFVSYTKFLLYDILPLTKPQAISLIDKLDFWDNESKNHFLSALDNRLFFSHEQFASNPLLLTIMLMTYSTFGEVPAKMHVFYSKAYETMARLHDASKGSFKRPFHTKLTPEEFAKYFSDFCARTYVDEVFEFNQFTFTSYMEKTLKGHSQLTPRDFLLDLTDNLCIMYHEGEKYYFIHRSFQEYFAAVYFASVYDERLVRVGEFFESIQHRSYTDRTFDMLYDMIPEKVERYIFLPFLKQLFNECKASDNNDDYWEFLENQYPVIYYEEGNTGDIFLNNPQSFIYEKILRENRLAAMLDLDELSWPEQLSILPRRNWVTVFSHFMETSAYERNPDPENIDIDELEDTEIIPEDDLPYRYIDYFGDPDIEGSTIEIEIDKLRSSPSEYGDLRVFMESIQFPLMQEYININNYYEELKSRAQKEIDSEKLFDE